MSDPLEFESRDTPFPVALAGMIGIAKALFEGFYGVFGIAVATWWTTRSGLEPSSSASCS